MSASAPEAIHTGYLTKHGAVVKNWKLRFCVLLKNGKLLYFKKPPKDWTSEEPKGTLNVQSDVVELVLWDESIEKGLVKWEKDAVPHSGFCLKTRQGRLWSLHAESPEACDKWVDAIRTVGANIRKSDATEEAIKKRGERAAAADAAADADAAPAGSAEAESGEGGEGAAHGDGDKEGGADGGSPKKYVNKVIGGVVVKVENTEWKYKS